METSVGELEKMPCTFYKGSKSPPIVLIELGMSKMLEKEETGKENGGNCQPKLGKLGKVWLLGGSWI